MIASQSPLGEDAGLREILKRCSPSTYEAARVFRQTGNPRYLPAIVRGILQPFVDESLQSKLEGSSEDLLLSQDLGIDSLALMEVAIVAEDAVGFPVDSEELRRVRTVGEMERALAVKTQTLPGQAA